MLNENTQLTRWPEIFQPGFFGEWAKFHWGASLALFHRGFLGECWDRRVGFFTEEWDSIYRGCHGGQRFQKIILPRSSLCIIPPSGICLFITDAIGAILSSEAPINFSTKAGATTSVGQGVYWIDIWGTTFNKTRLLPTIRIHSWYWEVHWGPCPFPLKADQVSFTTSN